MSPETLQFFNENRGERPLHYQKCTHPRQVLLESGLPYLPIVGFQLPIEAMYEEAKKLIPLMVHHRAGYEENVGWKSLVLHGVGPYKTEHADKYDLNPDDPEVYGWTEIAELAPVTAAFFKNQFRYRQYQRIRFMLLEPGGYISPHQDTDKYVLGPVNIALNNPDGCDFVMRDKGTLPFRQGTIMKLALVNHHAVFNNSDEPRLHMIVHGEPDPDFWGPVIMESFTTMIQQPHVQQRHHEDTRDLR